MTFQCARLLIPDVGTLRRSAAATVVLGLATIVLACDGGVRSPGSPSATPASADRPAATYTLSGAVFEDSPSGQAAVAGVRVAVAQRSAITDGSGLYSIPGLSPMSGSVAITKDGYVAGTRTVTIDSDTHLDIRIQRIASYTLSGMVFETTSQGAMPLEGVDVYCDSCGSPEGHTFAQTAADGSYRFAWTHDGANPLFVTKEGYRIVDPTGKLLDALGRVNVTVKGDTTFDIELARK